MFRLAYLGALAIAALIGLDMAASAVAQTKAGLHSGGAIPAKSVYHVRVPAKKDHRVVIQVSQNDPALMTTALNNAENLVAYYQAKGETVKVEFVAYGAGLHMLRNDTSPVKARLRGIAESLKQVTFSGCGNTMASQSKQESKEVTLAPEARVVPSGIARIAELSEQGWTYIRP